VWRELCGVSLGPQPGDAVMLFVVLQELGRDAAHQRIPRIAVCEERADGEEDFGDGERGRPVVFEDIEANHSLTVDVAVVDACAEEDFWGLERVLWREVDVQEEDSAFVDGTRRSKDGGDPLIEVVSLGPSAAVGGRVQSDFRQFFLDSPSTGAQSF